jgi:hypothetical protein
MTSTSLQPELDRVTKWQETSKERRIEMEEDSIRWLKFAESLRERYAYLLNLDFCLRIARDAREFAKYGEVKGGE